MILLFHQSGSVRLVSFGIADDYDAEWIKFSRDIEDVAEVDLSVLIWINLQPEAPQPQVFRFEQDVFCGSCAVEGPFVRKLTPSFLPTITMAADAFLAGPATMLL